MSRTSTAPRHLVGSVHDVTLILWSAVTLARALGFRWARTADTAIVAANLVSGIPAALERLRTGRRDPVALIAPVAVAAAVATTLRGGWAPVAALSVLHLVAAAERRRAGAMTE
ncbi:hypothetical protein [Mycobacterium sp.]|uniref:hypothetical protein n=1 Tax=Mycobacterium sp. TaxID=1785 RepID=UPI002C25BA22|nr:hypothetical protein [Mycobacterium sp.]HME47045.1 hypothetical protein [Mycobacterium sp.]